MPEFCGKLNVGWYTILIVFTW